MLTALLQLEELDPPKRTQCAKQEAFVIMNAMYSSEDYTSQHRPIHNACFWSWWRQIWWETAAKKMEETLTSTWASVPSVTLLQLPNLSSKNITVLHPLKRDTFVIMRLSTNCFYIGQVLDLYKRGADPRYGFIELASSAQGLSWLPLLSFKTGACISCYTLLLDCWVWRRWRWRQKCTWLHLRITCALKNNKYHLHTHAPANHLIYHLSHNALLGDNQLRKSLSPLASSYWKAVQCTKAVMKQHLPVFKIRIPAGKRSDTLLKA